MQGNSALQFDLPRCGMCCLCHGIALVQVLWICSHADESPPKTRSISAPKSLGAGSAHVLKCRHLYSILSILWSESSGSEWRNHSRVEALESQASSKAGTCGLNPHGEQAAGILATPFNSSRPAHVWIFLNVGPTPYSSNTSLSTIS